MRGKEGGGEGLRFMGHSCLLTEQGSGTRSLTYLAIRLSTLPTEVGRRQVAGAPHLSVRVPASTI